MLIGTLIFKDNAGSNRSECIVTEQQKKNGVITNKRTFDNALLRMMELTSDSSFERYRILAALACYALTRMAQLHSFPDQQDHLSVREYY